MQFASPGAHGARPRNSETIMRKMILPAVIALSLGMSSMAMAYSSTTTDGTIKAIDAKACTITLTNKATYHFAKKCDVTAFKVGEKVAITWHAYKKIDVATKIAAWTAPAPAKKS